MEAVTEAEAAAEGVAAVGQGAAAGRQGACERADDGGQELLAALEEAFELEEGELPPEGEPAAVGQPSPLQFGPLAADQWAQRVLGGPGEHQPCTAKLEPLEDCEQQQQRAQHAQQQAQQQAQATSEAQVKDEPHDGGPPPSKRPRQPCAAGEEQQPQHPAAGGEQQMQQGQQAVPDGQQPGVQAQQQASPQSGQHREEQQPSAPECGPQAAPQQQPTPVQPLVSQALYQMLAYWAPAVQAEQAGQPSGLIMQAVQAASKQFAATGEAGLVITQDGGLVLDVVPIPPAFIAERLEFVKQHIGWPLGHVRLRAELKQWGAQQAGRELQGRTSTGGTPPQLEDQPMQRRPSGSVQDAPVVRKSQRLLQRQEQQAQQAQQPAPPAPLPVEQPRIQQAQQAQQQARMQQAQFTQQQAQQQQQQQAQHQAQQQQADQQWQQLLQLARQMGQAYQAQQAQQQQAYQAQQQAQQAQQLTAPALWNAAGLVASEQQAALQPANLQLAPQAAQAPGAPAPQSAQQPAAQHQMAQPQPVQAAQAHVQLAGQQQAADPQPAMQQHVACPQPTVDLAAVRERMRVHVPLIQQLKIVQERLEREEAELVRQYDVFWQSGNRAHQDRVHARWQQVTAKLALLRSSSSRFVAQHGLEYGVQ